MHVNGSAFTSIWYDPHKHSVFIIDQTTLPHRFEVIALNTLEDFCRAISHMQVRGAPLIGVTAAFGLALALTVDSSAEALQSASQQLLATRPTAVNLAWALNRVNRAVTALPAAQRAEQALQLAEQLRREDIHNCEAIGEHGLQLFQSLLADKPATRQSLQILTHCNAGWLATIDWGTALAPIYKAHLAGLDIHVWVDETRPRNQGASLTAWELAQQGIPHTVIADNTGGHLMQQGMIDLCLVGSDRTTANGDVCNKIGTYLKALAASDNQLPFYVALPTSTIDWQLHDGLKQIPIEQRSDREVTHISGIDSTGKLTEVQLVANSPAANYAFDVTPARLISGLITEHGVFQAKGDSLKKLQQFITG
jgi:methylthioribose-1-phosphate isomerase